MSASIIQRLLFCFALALPLSSWANVPAAGNGEPVLPAVGTAAATCRAAASIPHTHDSVSSPESFATGGNLHAQRVPRGGDKVFHGNRKTKRFHASSCRYFDCKNCVAIFRSRERAIRAGYVPCKVCRP